MRERRGGTDRSKSHKTNNMSKKGLVRGDTTNEGRGASEEKEKLILGTLECVSCQRKGIKVLLKRQKD